MSHVIHHDIHRVEDVFSEEGGGHTFDFRHQLVECVECDSFAYRHVDAEHMPYTEHVSAYPVRWKHHPPAWVEDLPREVSDVLNQVYVAIANGLDSLALIGMRLTLDIATLRLLPKEHSLNKRIDTLCKKTGSPFKAEDRELLNVVKDAGDAAAHRGLGLNERLTIRLVSLLEHVLHRIDIEPIELAERMRTSSTIAKLVPPDPRRKPKTKPT